MQAAILSIGDELTLGQNLDTNSQWLAAQLAEHSILAAEHRTLADDRDAIAEAIRELASRNDVLLITGGLGPTEDDLTREALGDVLTPGEPLVNDPQAAERLERLFARRGRPMPEMNRKQATHPRTMRLMPNPNGTAPGLAGELGRCLVFSMPGPPREMFPMFADHVLPTLLQAKGEQGGEAIITAMVREYGMGESDAAERLGGMMGRDRNPLVGTTASDSIVTARIRGRGDAETVKSQVAAVADDVERLWTPYAFGRGEVSLVDAVATLIAEAGLTLATAESCTGGWLGKLIVDRAGSSEFYLGGIIAYSNALKTSLLGVPADLIERHGAVSREVAIAMAEGAIRMTNADCALSITGVAGPGGGTAKKPVGTVHVGFGMRTGDSVKSAARHFIFSGDRMTIRDRAAKAALQMLRFGLLRVPDDVPLLWEIARGREGGGEKSTPAAQAASAGR